jgi:hypothetical protein
MTPDDDKNNDKDKENKDNGKDLTKNPNNYDYADVFVFPEDLSEN